MTLVCRAQAPAKIMLLGEWSVLNGAPAVLSTLNNWMDCYYENSPDELVISDGHITESLQNKTDNSEFFNWNRRFLKTMFEYFDIQTNSGRFTWKRSWQLNEGLGSSSAAFLTSYLCIAHGVKNNVILEWPEIYALFRKISQGSGADLAAQFHGKSICFINGHVEELNLEFPKNLKIIHTGFKADTQTLIQKNQNIDKSIISLIEESTYHFLQDHDWHRAFKTHYAALSKTKLIPQVIKVFFEHLTEQNILSAFKTTGAGGGDAILCLVNSGREEELEKAIRAQGFWINQASFVTPGARVIDI